MREPATENAPSGESTLTSGLHLGYAFRNPNLGRSPDFEVGRERSEPSNTIASCLNGTLRRDYPMFVAVQSDSRVASPYGLN